MKTKTIDVWINKRELNVSEGGNIQLYRPSKENINKNGVMYKAKLVIELPEKRISITESELREALDESDRLYDIGEKDFNYNLIKELFGED